MYGKIENGDLIPAPAALQIEQTFLSEDGEEIKSLQNVGNPTPEQYLAAGYLPIRYTDAPEAPKGYHYEGDYTEDGGEIVQVWALVDDPAPSDEDEISAEEALDIIFGGDENAVD